MVQSLAIPEPRITVHSNFELSTTTSTADIDLSLSDNGTLTLTLTSNNPPPPGVAVRGGLIALTLSPLVSPPVIFVIKFTIKTPDWTFISPFAAEVAEGDSNNLAFLLPRTTETTLTVNCANNMKAGDFPVFYTLAFGFINPNKEQFWVNDPAIAFNPPST